MEKAALPDVANFQEPVRYALKKSQSFAPHLTKFYVLFPVLLTAYVIYTRYWSGISHIPGPWTASVSNLWKINAAWQQEMPQRNIELHKKFGPLVRIGPKMISVVSNELWLVCVIFSVVNQLSI